MRGHPEFPLVRITLQGMEHSIIHAMQDHFVKMDEACSKAVREAIASFDYEGEVRRMAHQLIKDGIKSALEREVLYGPPYEKIKEVARVLMRKALEKEAG
jgi:16S rRNA G966 N2-methylase RsmD